MITYKAFQGLENFYIKFQDFPYFSRICVNPECLIRNGNGLAIAVVADVLSLKTKGGGLTLHARDLDLINFT